MIAAQIHVWRFAFCWREIDCGVVRTADAVALYASFLGHCVDFLLRCFVWSDLLEVHVVMAA